MRHDENSHDDVARDVRRGHDGGADGIPTADELRFVERYADAIDAYVDGSLDATSRLELERAARSDARLREALADATFAATFFAGVPTPRADRALDARILGAIDAESARGTGRAPHRTRSPRPSLRTWGALAAAAAVLALMFVGNAQQWFRANDADPSTFVAADGTVYTEAEVQAATEQMEMAMAVFGRTMDRTTRAVRSDLTGDLREFVSDPLREGLGRSVNSIPFLRPRGGEQEHSGNIPEPPAGERPLRSRALEGAHIGERT